MKYFYIRVSSTDQNPARQEVMATEHSISPGNVYIEKVSGKNVTDRPVLANMMKVLKSGDTVIVESISRFARSTVDFITLVEQLNDKGVTFISLKEQIDTHTPQGIFMMTVFAAMAQFERDQTRQRQAEGIAIAKQQGKYKGRTPITYPKEWARMYPRIKSKEVTHVEAMRIMQIKKNSFYKLLRQYDQENP